MIIDMVLEKGLWYEGKAKDPRAIYILRSFGPGTGIKTGQTSCAQLIVVKNAILHGGVEKMAKHLGLGRLFIPEENI